MNSFKFCLLPHPPISPVQVPTQALEFPSFQFCHPSNTFKDDPRFIHFHDHHLLSVILSFNFMASADHHSSQHFQKIRKEARSGGSNSGGTSPVRSTPNSRVTKPSTAAKSTPRKSKLMTDSLQTFHSSFSTNDGSFDNSYPDDNEEMATPTKSQRTMKPEGQENDQPSPSLNVKGKGGEHKGIGLENGK